VVRSEEVAASPTRYDLRAFRCPACGEWMVFVRARTRYPHFRHRHGTCGFYSERDVEEHLAMKEAVLQWLRGIGVGDAEYEERVGNNIADVYSPGLGLAVEVQYSGIGYGEFVRRTSGYAESGVHVLWLFHTRFLSFSRRGAASLRSKALRVASYLYRGRVFLLDQYARKIYVLHLRKHGKKGSVKRRTKYLCTFAVLDLTRPADHRDILELGTSEVGGRKALIAAVVPPAQRPRPCYELRHLVKSTKRRLERRKEARRRPARPWRPKR